MSLKLEMLILYNYSKVSMVVLTLSIYLKIYTLKNLFLHTKPNILCLLRII